MIREVTRPSFRAKNNRSKMSKNIIHVEGYDAFKEAANINKEKTVFALFSGSIEENGSSLVLHILTVLTVQ